MKRPATILILGVQGSGKGTQAELLARRVRMPFYSVGALLREEIRRNTQFGRLAAPYVRRGELVPDDVANAFARLIALRRPGKSIIFDGYPRSLGQARALAALRPPTVVIDVRLADREALVRLTGRRVCPSCGAVWHVRFHPSPKGARCGRCGTRLTTRPDDQPATIRRRLAVYHAYTDPVLRYYRRTKRLVTIDGNRPIAAVAHDVAAAVRQRLRP